MGSILRTNGPTRAQKHASELFFNRELSWLEFNARVLEESLHEVHPLLSRMRFISIFYSNLDEFFMIRVAGIKEQIRAGVRERGPDGLTPRQTLQRIRERVRQLLTRAQAIFGQHLLPALEEEDIFIYQGRRLSRLPREQLHTYFTEKVFPLLTPLALDSAHPVPPLRGLELILWVELKNGAALVPIPQVLPRFVPFHSSHRYGFVPIEALVGLFLEELFPGRKVRNYFTFRITRDADIEISEAEADDLLVLVERELRQRRLGAVVRFEYSTGMPPETLRFLQEELAFDAEDTYEVEGFLGLERLWDILAEVDEPSLIDRPFVPAIPPALQGKSNIFEAIAQGDILLHHPYDSFAPVAEFIQAAARDPNVLAIKQTLYRTTGEKSLIVQALREAVDRGKQVTVLIELKARFDEETNIYWARELEKAGANVIYGMLGLKIHAKCALVVRKEGNALRLYAHLSTGNYNEKTAQIYTDIGLLTANPAITRDLAELFNYLTGNSGQQTWRRIAVAPENLRETFLQEIQRCLAEHSPERPSRIVLVLNALVDTEMIRALYAASSAGVQVDLMVRGICCLVPGTPLSQNIRVHSIIGRFLEHSRLYIFQSGGETRVWSGSADWMPRNLDRRVEIAFPIQDPRLAEQAIDIAETLLRDSLHSWVLLPDGTYQRRRLLEPDLPPLSAQKEFLRRRRLLVQEKEEEPA
ncbi:MAG: polyphosphate kinase 1 [Bacteroidia bacterium]|nr:polyphosphate kinase 1 [Bacteroidia bacterium]GIV23563.1 MAG: polyphosphate kinase [Bacteroidia bacterium]